MQEKYDQLHNSLLLGSGLDLLLLTSSIPCRQSSYAALQKISRLRGLASSDATGGKPPVPPAAATVAKGSQQ